MAVANQRTPHHACLCTLQPAHTSICELMHVHIRRQKHTFVSSPSVSSYVSCVCLSSLYSAACAFHPSAHACSFPTPCHSCPYPPYHSCHSCLPAPHSHFHSLRCLLTDCLTETYCLHSHCYYHYYYSNLSHLNLNYLTTAHSVTMSQPLRVCVLFRGHVRAARCPGAHSDPLSLALWRTAMWRAMCLCVWPLTRVL